ncbi:MAG: L-threonylcarbamoyladenylate synthase [Actinomycetales bacterium]|nr:L-threonylcarbamoyladenylate synthase [Actinomycetales bacterium]
MSQIFDLSDQPDESVLAEAAAAAAVAISNSELVLIPTDTSYAIICDAFNPSAVAKLRGTKRQTESVSIPVGAGNMATVDGIASFSEVGRDLVDAFWPGSLTVLTKNQPSVQLAVKNADQALAVRIPNNPIAIAVLNATGPAAMTGAQLSGGKPTTTISAVREIFGDAVTIYIDGGVLPGGQSSLVSALGENLRLIRAGELSLDDLRKVVPTLVDATKTRPS